MPEWESVYKVQYFMLGQLGWLKVVYFDIFLIETQRGGLDRQKYHDIVQDLPSALSSLFSVSEM